MLLVTWALATGELDEVWVLPTGGHPFGKPLAQWEHRLEMCWRAFECFGERVSLLDVEREARVHYSIDTLRAIRQNTPPAYQYRWIMGSDTLADAPRWREWETLMREAPPLVVPRAGYPLADGSLPALALPNISSTEIRERLAAGDFNRLRTMLPGPVIELIQEKKLYRDAV